MRCQGGSHPRDASPSTSPVLVKGEPRDPVGALALVRGEHVLILLRDADRGDPRPAGAGLRIQVPAHHLDLAVTPGEFTTGISLARPNESTPRRNLVPIFSKIAGEGIDNPKCRVMNETTCPPPAGSAHTR